MGSKGFCKFKAVWILTTPPTKNEINRTIKDYKSEINRLEGFRKREQGQIDRNQNVLIKIENTLGSIKDTEQLIEKLNKDIEETYESIKHLIPFSDYL